MKKKKNQYKSLLTKNHEIEQNTFFDGVSLLGYVAS